MSRRPRWSPDPLDRRRLLRQGALSVAGALAAPLLNFGRVSAASGVELSTRAVDLVLGTTAIDMLGLITLDWQRLFAWQAHPESWRDADFRELEHTGVNVMHPAVETNAGDAYAAALKWSAGWNRLLDGTPCYLDRVSSAWDLGGVPARGEIGIILGFQNSDHFRTVADVEAFSRLGQRISQLTYNRCNRIGCGCYVGNDHGLTRYGVEIVREMNRVGMAVDLSHCGERTTIEAIALSRVPVLVTHSNCRALVPRQPRCKSDRVIRELAKKGGVIGMTVVRGFVGEGWPALPDLLDHFEHVAKLVGIEHVGIGSDVDVAALDPRTHRRRDFYSIRGLDLPLRLFQIADGLLARGYSERDVAGVLGGNFRRVLGEIWLPEPNARRVSDRDPFCPAPRPLAPPAAE